MIEYRPFRNTDSPAIVDIWRQQPPLPAMLQPLTVMLLEDTVLSKTCFDPQGLILAWDQERPLGVVHGGFGPSREGTRMDRSVGTTCMLLVVPHDGEQHVAEGLLAQSEAYLRAHGATRLLGGSTGSLAPFYLGLYGGAGLPGVLGDDSRMLSFFRRSGYADRERRQIWQCELGSYRPAIDRRQMQLRRTHEIKTTADPPVENWWDACHAGRNERTHFTAHSKIDHAPVGYIGAWDMEPWAASRGIHAQGLERIEVDAKQEYEPLAMYLVGEVLRIMAAAGASLVETHATSDGVALMNVLDRQGFALTGDGVLLERLDV